MIRVAICDDEVAIGAELETILIDIFTPLNVDHEIEVFLNGNALCREMDAGCRFDLIFLDIEYSKSEPNGVALGRLIRERYQNNIVSIVYISWEKKYAMDLFDIRPMNFLIKPLAYEKIRQTVNTYLTISGLGTRELVYKKGHDTFKVPAHEIIYLENRQRKIIIHFAGGRTDEFYGSLKDIYNDLLKDLDFLFIHASYVVNYDYVTVVKYNQLFITNSAVPLPISPNKKNGVRERYLEIIKKRKVQ